MEEKPSKCAQCGRRLYVRSMGFDLADTKDKGAEVRFYNSHYSAAPLPEKKNAITDFAKEWHRVDQPQNKSVRRFVGSVTGKRVLLLGNGASRKELTFLLDNPKTLVYSDISLAAVSRLILEVDTEPYEETLHVAAIDAECLPFEDCTFDIVYAYAMVHHLPNLSQFLKETYRVLTPDGRAIFMDDAFSPMWHWSKRTWLKPLMRYSHNTKGISPEDLRFSLQGGFKETALANAIKQTGGTPFFKKEVLMGYLLVRGATKLLPAHWAASERLSQTLGWLGRIIDGAIEALPITRNQCIRLIWGYSKQADLETK